LDLTSISETGIVGIVTYLFSGKGWAPLGTVTEFEDFNVWSLGD
jgi:hypothetical protein